MATASLPERRSTAMAPVPGEVETAHIVDWSSIFIFLIIVAKI
jgi:hypothetical protein